LVKNKIEYLDSLRGIAALTVVIFHFLADFYPATITMNINDSHFSIYEAFLKLTPVNVFYNGTFAVYIFFVLSGYVLTYKYFKTKNEQVVVSGAIKRYFRLLGPVAASIFLSYILLKLGFMRNIDASIYTKSQFLGGFYQFSPNFYDAAKQAFFDIWFASSVANHYNAVLWTIHTEFIGSMFVFITCLFCGKLRNRFLIYFILIIATLNTYYFCFTLGMLLADIYNSERNKFVIKDNFAPLIIIVGLFLGSYQSNTSVYNFIYHPMDLPYVNSINIYYTLGAALILLGLLNWKKLQETLNNKFLLFLGSISFSMYVLHRIIITSYTSWLFTVLIPHMPYNIAFIVSFIPSMILIFGGSYLMYKYIDLNSKHVANYIYSSIFAQNDKINFMNTKAQQEDSIHKGCIERQ